MLKQTRSEKLQVCLSTYDLLLPPGIKGLRMKEIRMQVFNQNYTSQLNLILIFSQVPLFVVLTVLKLSKRNGERFNNRYY